jgi:hypothetical protein
MGTLTEDDAKAAAAALLKLMSKASYKADAEAEDDLRGKLKAYAEQTKAKFNFENAVGSIAVSRPSEEKFDGLFFDLNARVFLALSDKERHAMQAEDYGKLGLGPLVSEKAKWTTPRAPSITVKFAA